MQIFHALLYLRLMMVRNLTLSFFRRLKQPRYLLGLGMAALYFWSVFFRRSGRDPSRPMFNGFGDTLELAGAGIVMLFVLGMWLLPGAKAGLRFTEAEVAFLFGAPLKRSQLIHYKLLTGMLSSLLGALFFTLLSTRFRGGAAHVLQYLMGWWLLNSLVSLHGTGLTFTLAKLGTGKVAVLLRRAAVAAIMLLFLASVVHLAANGTPDQLRMLLAPGRFVLQLFFASGLAFLKVLLLLLLLLAAHYWWVVKMETPFEEASIALATRRAELIARMRAGKGFRIGGRATARREPFVLRPQLPVELVLMWKNLMQLPSYLNRRVFIASVLLISIGLPWLRQHGGIAGQSIVGGLGIFAMIFIAYMLLFAPQVIRNDLRGDLAQADLLKAWPLAGWRIVLGNLLAPMVAMTAIGWLLVLTAAIGTQGGGKLAPWLNFPLKMAISTSFALAMPVLSALFLIGPNAVALYFPAWSPVGVSTQRGLDTMGLRLVLMLGQAVLLVFTLVPALLLAAVVFYLSRWFTTTPVGIMLATIAALLVLALEILYAIHLLGERFERLDIAAELRQ